MCDTMRKLIEYGMLCCYKSSVMRWFVTAPSILAFLLWCFAAFNEYGKIMQLTIPLATYCLYGNYLYYIARFGMIFSIMFILLAALPSFMDGQARGGMILKTLPESAPMRCIARFILVIILTWISLLMMLFTIMTAICVTDRLFPELSLSLYDRRLQFLEYGVRLVLNMTGVVLIQTVAHLITKSVYLPIAFGGIMAILTNGMYNPFAAMMDCYDGNVPLF